MCICDKQRYNFNRMHFYHELFIPAFPLKVKLVAKEFLKNMSKQAFFANFQFSNTFVEA